VSVVRIARGDRRRAVRLFATTATAPRSKDPFLLAGPLEVHVYLATTRLVLGADEFVAAWADGHVVSLESAVELALAEEYCERPD
jgi:hypothetical protein